MAQSQIVVTRESFMEVQTLLEDFAATGQGGEVFVKRFRELCERHGWDWFGLEPRALFNWRAMSLLSAAGYAHYCAQRREELRKGGFALWIFIAGPDCADEHRALDGIALAPEHEFWRRYAPPLGWRCDCYVVGARSDRGAARLGGDVESRCRNGGTSLTQRLSCGLVSRNRGARRRTLIFHFCSQRSLGDMRLCRIEFYQSDYSAATLAPAPFSNNGARYCPV